MMTGITATNFLTSDEVDLEDGEIASDDDAEKVTPPPLEKRQNVERAHQDTEKKIESNRSRETKPERNHGERKNRRSRFQDADAPADEPERKKQKTSMEKEGSGETGENEDELLGLFVRGGSPDNDSPDPNAALWKPKATGHMNASWGNDDDRKRRRVHSPSMDKRNRDGRDPRSRIQMKRKMKPPRKGVADKDVCLNYLKGACNKGNDCYYSHNVCQPRKMELCKFYLKDCCMKRDKCLYLHEEFPCKFFHTGLKCYANKNCKFSHEPLNNFTREVLLKHVETAPKDILGDFPRMSRENAEAAMGNMGRFSGDRPEGDTDDFRMKQQQQQQDGNNDSPRRDFPDRRQPNNDNFADNQRFNRDDGFMDGGNRRRSPDQRFGGPRFDRNSPADDGNRFRGRRNDEDDRRRGDFDDRRRGNNRNNRDGDNRNFGRFRNDHDHRNNNNNNSRNFDNNGQNMEYNNQEPNQFSNNNNFVPNSQFFGQSDQNGPRDVDNRRGGHCDEDFRQQQQKPEPSRFQGDTDERVDKQTKEKQVPAVDSTNNSGTSSPFDFAKELAEYKNKKMELEMKQQQEPEPVQEPPSQVVIEKPAQLLPKEEQQPVQPASDIEFTQNYPPFPEKKRHHHHHKKKRKHSAEGDNEDRESRKSRKERKEKKRQPVIITEDGSFGGIKFKIKLNPVKEEPAPAPNRRHSEFMSSDDEIPLNFLQKRKDKDDGDETDTENRLVIETHDEPEDVKPVASHQEVPVHLPRRQQRLFQRIQSHQNRVVDDACGYSNSPKDRTPTPQPADADADENWYSSDDEGAQKAAGGASASAAAAAAAAPSNPVPSISYQSDAKEEAPKTTANEQQPTPPPQIELTALKDLSKINITQLLSSIRQITSTSHKPQETVSSNNPANSVQHKNTDPRFTSPRRTSAEERPPYAKSIYEVSNLPNQAKDSDFRRETNNGSDKSVVHDVDLRLLEDGHLPPLKLGLPFKPVPQHSAATEIEASLASHPPMDYKVQPIFVPPPDFSTLKISPNDPIVKRDPRLRRLFRVSSAEEPKNEDPRQSPSGPVDPRRKINPTNVPDTPRSPTDTPFSPPQESVPAPRLTPNLLALVQLGLSAATGGTAFDPRLRSLLPQDLEALRTAVSGLRPEDMDTIRAMESGAMDSMPGPSRPNPGLLPTPPGVGLLPTPTNFMMNSMMPMDPMMVGPMGPMPGPMGMGPGGPMNPMNPHMNQQMPNFGGFGGEPNDMDMRMFRGNNNGGFKGDRRGGRNSWRGNPRGDRNNWNDRRHRDRDDRGRGRDHRDKDDRRERDRRSYSPD